MKSTSLTREEYVNHIRWCWKERLRVLNEEDLPYVLISEVINIAILNKASFIRVSHNRNAKTITIETNQLSRNTRPVFQVCNYCGESIIPYLSYLYERQWGEGGEYAMINALCTHFYYIQSKKSIKCNNGIPIEMLESNVEHDGTKVVFTPFIDVELNDEVVRKLLSWIRNSFKVRCEYNGVDCANCWHNVPTKNDCLLLEKMTRDEYKNTFLW